MGRLVPTAVSLGISFEDLAGVMAVMSRTGLDAAEASTSLNSIMSLLAKGGTKAAQDINAAYQQAVEVATDAGVPGFTRNAAGQAVDRTSEAGWIRVPGGPRGADGKRLNPFGTDPELLGAQKNLGPAGIAVSGILKSSNCVSQRG